MPRAGAARQQLDGHRVQHLVAHHHAAQGIGQLAGPAHAFAMRRQPRLLARAQGARHIDDGVARQRLAERIQRVDQAGRQRAGAGAELPHLIRAGGGQAFGDLRGQRAREQRRQLGRRHEVAAVFRQHAELACVTGVIA